MVLQLIKGNTFLAHDQSIYFHELAVGWIHSTEELEDILSI